MFEEGGQGESGASTVLGESGVAFPAEWPSCFSDEDSVVPFVQVMVSGAWCGGGVSDPRTVCSGQGVETGASGAGVGSSHGRRRVLPPGFNAVESSPYGR